MNRLDEKREDALDEIARDYAEQLISQSEYERMARRLSIATTETEIEAVVRDRSRPHEYQPESRSVSTTQAITAVLGERKMRGDWIHGDYVSATALMGAIRLDLRECDLPELTRIHVVTVMGETQIIVPSGVEVRNDISAFLAETNDTSGPPPGGRRHRRRSHQDRPANARAEQSASPPPVVVVTGFALMAEVKVVRR